MESTIKQINWHSYGAEEFWFAGIEPLLALIAKQLSEQAIPPLKSRPHRAPASKPP